MLKIYGVALEMTPEVERLMERIGERNRELCKQLKGSWPSVVLNIAEGSGSRGGNRRLRYENALASAREAWSTLEYGEAAGYIAPIDHGLRRRFDHVIGVLVRILF